MKKDLKIQDHPQNPLKAKRSLEIKEIKRGIKRTLSLIINLSESKKKKHKRRKKFLNEKLKIKLKLLKLS
jgi:transcription initiation factor TFIIIB Brf1 subunit/transcription initiation factor TFIIB